MIAFVVVVATLAGVAAWVLRHKGGLRHPAKIGPSPRNVAVKGECRGDREHRQWGAARGPRSFQKPLACLSGLDGVLVHNEHAQFHATPRGRGGRWRLCSIGARGCHPGMTKLSQWCALADCEGMHLQSSRFACVAAWHLRWSMSILVALYVAMVRVGAWTAGTATWKTCVGTVSRTRAASGRLCSRCHSQGGPSHHRALPSVAVGVQNPNALTDARPQKVCCICASVCKHAGARFRTVALSTQKQSTRAQSTKLSSKQSADIISRRYRLHGACEDRCLYAP